MTTRRKFFKQAAVAGLGAALVSGSVTASPKQQRSGRSLRIAHVTDIHVVDQLNARTCLARIMAEINNMEDKPDLIINTGDSVMDENNQTRETVQRRWDMWKEGTAGNKIPMYSALGNHDVWYGPDKTLDEQYKKDKRYGKKWAIDMLGMPGSYYAFESKGWKFIALDSINGASGYQLDDEQFKWLEKELSSSGKKPVCVFNHVPILAIGPLLFETQRKPVAEVHFPSGDMHNDHQRIKDLFRTHEGVKLCLSGHVHYIDQVEYLGVTYMCNGAVSGNWWRDPIVLDEFPPVYSIIDLYDDGTVERQLKFYNYAV